MCWAAEKFYFYLSGRHCEIEMDHCPLLAVMERKELAKLSIRLQRFRLRMLGFDYSALYRGIEVLSILELCFPLKFRSAHKTTTIN